MRSVFQSHLYSLGCSIQKHAGKVLFVAILVLSTFCVGLKSATVHSKVHQLWIQGKFYPFFFSNTLRFNFECNSASGYVQQI